MRGLGVLGGIIAIGVGVAIIIWPNSIAYIVGAFFILIGIIGSLSPIRRRRSTADRLAGGGAGSIS